MRGRKREVNYQCTETDRSFFFDQWSQGKESREALHDSDSLVEFFFLSLTLTTLAGYKGHFRGKKRYKAMSHDKFSRKYRFGARDSSPPSNHVHSR